MLGDREAAHLLPKILLNSVPKSGTNLLYQLVMGIPATKVSEISRSGFNKRNFNQLRDLQNAEVAYGHIEYRLRFARQLEKWGIKQVFISRDPRDVVISAAHFITDTFYEHPLHRYFVEHLNTHEERILAVIKGVRHRSVRRWNFSHPSIYREYKPIYEWKGTPGVCCITFEDLVKDQQSQDMILMKITDFLWGEEVETAHEKRYLIELMKRNVDPDASWTFRKGKPGEWRNEFTEEHKAAFKETTGDLLIRLGYEKDADW